MTTPPQTAEFNLSLLVRTMLADLPIADPRAVAAKLIDDLTDEECRRALAVTLPDYVRNRAGMAARSTQPAFPKRTTTPQRVSSWYAEILGSRMFNGETWKFLRDCTAEDLQGAAAERYKAATRTHAEGDRIMRLADHLEANAYAVVAEVPQDDLKSFFGDESVAS